MAQGPRTPASPPWQAGAIRLPVDLLVYVAELLERLGIPYHVGGSVSSSAHGMFRASPDIDFVIDATRDQLEALATGPPCRRSRRVSE